MKPFKFLVAVFLSFVALPAFAQVCRASTNQTCDEGIAHAACKKALAFSLDFPNATVATDCERQSVSGVNAYECRVNRGLGVNDECWMDGQRNSFQLYFFWPGQTCLQRNADLGGVNQEVRWASDYSMCLAGCKYAIVTGEQTKTITGGGRQYGGLWEYTGDTCDGSIGDGQTKTPPPKEPVCTPAQAGQTFCTMPNGDQCHTASTGRSICWGPTEAGTRTDGPTAQTNGPGAQPVQPTVTPPPGATFNQGASTTVNNTTNNGTSAVTITNFTTSNGGPAGSTNTGTGTGSNGGPVGGSGSGPSTCDPTKQVCGASAGGGFGCESAPNCAGDAVGCETLQQVWRNRCLPNGNKAAGGACTEYGTVNAFACSGDQILCKQALTAAEHKCHVQLSDKNANGQPDWAEPNGDDTGPNPGEDPDGDPLEITLSPGFLDRSGFLGGGSCPTLGTISFGRFGSFSFDSVPWFCQLITITGALLVFMAAFAALRILMGE